MRIKAFGRIMTAAAFALSLMQCIIVPGRVSPVPATVHVTTTTQGKLEPTKPSPPKIVYRVGDVVDVSGIMRYDGDKYYIDVDNSNARVKFVGNRVSEANSFKANLNRHVTIKLRILSASGDSYEADFLSWG